MKTGRKIYDAPAIKSLTVDEVVDLLDRMKLSDRERFFAAWPALEQRVKERFLARP